jgi:hypothetical protein
MLSKHQGNTKSTTDGSECTLHVRLRCAGSTRLQARGGGVGSARATRRGSCSLCTTDDGKRGDSGLLTIGQSRGVQDKGADSTTAGSVSSNKSGSLGIRGGNNSSTSSTRENDTGTELVGSGHNFSSASTTSAATWHRGLDRANDITVLVDGNAGNG